MRELQYPGSSPLPEVVIAHHGRPLPPALPGPVKPPHPERSHGYSVSNVSVEAVTQETVATGRNRCDTPVMNWWTFGLTGGWLGASLAAAGLLGVALAWWATGRSKTLQKPARWWAYRSIARRERKEAERRGEL